MIENFNEEKMRSNATEFTFVQSTLTEPSFPNILLIDTMFLNKKKKKMKNIYL